MAVYIDSFDHYSSSVLSKWTDVGAFAPAIVAGVGRCGSQAMRVSVFNAVTKGVNYGSATTIQGFAMQIETATASGLTFLGIGNGTADHLLLNRTVDGALHVYRHDSGGNTLLGSSAVDVFRDDTFYYIEIKSLIHASAGTVDVRVNNASVITLTGQDTLSDLTGASVTRFSFYGVANSNYLIDDLYTSDASEAAPLNDFWGDTHIEARWPEGVGASQEWDLVGAASHWQAVHDSAAPDGDTSYISTATVNEIDLQTYEDTALPAGTIYGVQTNVYARKTDAGYRGISPVIRHSGTNYLGTEQNPSHASYRYLHEFFAENPGTSAAWTISDFNAAQFGVKLTT